MRGHSPVWAIIAEPRRIGCTNSATDPMGRTMGWASAHKRGLIGDLLPTEFRALHQTDDAKMHHSFRLLPCFPLGPITRDG